jgi:hypothetical protein
MTWYEVLPIVHNREAHVENEFDDISEAFEQAGSLAKALRADEDTASWSISVIAHSCDKNGTDCVCRLEVQVGSYYGVVVPREFPPPVEEEEIDG